MKTRKKEKFRQNVAKYMLRIMLKIIAHVCPLGPPWLLSKPTTCFGNGNRVGPAEVVRYCIFGWLGGYREIRSICLILSASKAAGPVQSVFIVSNELLLGSVGV